jgi:hypothetical protein
MVGEEAFGASTSVAQEDCTLAMPHATFAFYNSCRTIQSHEHNKQTTTNLREKQ